ncbi:hypothetical protein GCM10027399_20130 [Curvibacter fontanus]|jgi:hypothetical protein
MPSRLLSRLVASGLLLAAGIAQAHYLWIEPAEDGARLFYGEAEAALKEGSPGRLDSIQGVRAFAMSASDAATRAVALRRTPGHLALAAPVQAASLLVQEESLPVRDLAANGLGQVKINYYARHGAPATGASQLTLDVQGQTPDTWTVVYRGRPLAHAKLEVIAPNTWVQEHQTDARGRVRINTPWRGLYVLHVLHVDKTPGEFAGQRYDNLRQHYTYSFVRTAGPDAGPAIPAQQKKD